MKAQLVLSNNEILKLHFNFLNMIPKRYFKIEIFSL